MIFNKGYYTAMDKGYYTSPEETPEQEQGLSPKDIGISAPPMQDQLQSLRAKIFQGASKVELGFTGRAKGSMGRQATTPEMYGMEERQDIKELAQFNKIELTTHATTAVGNLSGLAENRFSEQEREQALNEIKRAVDFAADTTKGGPVVIHTGEFPRAISEEYGKEKDMYKFRMFEKEPEQATFYLVDDRYGDIRPVRKDQDVYEPKYKTDPKTGELIDVEGKIIKPDAPIEELFARRMPIWKGEERRFETVKRTWQDFEKKAEEHNKLHPEEHITPEEMFYRTQIENQILQAKGASLFYAQDYDGIKKQYDKINEALKFYKKVWEATPEDERWKLKEQLRAEVPFVPPETADPVEYLERTKKHYENRMIHTHEASAAADVQARQYQETIDHIKTAKEYAVEKAADTIARAAEFAMQKEQQKKLEKPLFIAPENIFPELYGAHPQELKELVLKARERFVEKEKQRMGEGEARKQAEAHIKATFDLGHAYTWKKYFEGDPKKSIEENSRMFSEWLLKQVEDLNKSGVIGHVHISDNFGYEDEHVTPGQGSAPIKEFIEKMKKAGIKNVIVEPAHQDYKALLGGWKTFGSSIYGLATAGRRETWTDIEHSYFGRTAPPYFLYGEAAPSPEEWTLWTGVRME